MPERGLSALVILALVLFWAVGAYNRLVRLRAGMRTAFAALDARFAERLAWLGGTLAQPEAGAPGAASLPDDAAQPAAAPASLARLAAAAEQWTLALASARTQPVDGAAVSRLALAESVLHAAWDSVAVQDWASWVALESTPVLTQWERLLHQERPLLLAFNEAVQRYNAAIAQFPAALLARLCGFHAAQDLPLPPDGAP